ncbi:MAG: DUF7712 family protein [Actinomycetota bacterium]
MGQGRRSAVNEFGHECWIVETSKDGERWRFFGRAWKRPDQPILLHAVPRFVRFRLDGDHTWTGPLETAEDLPITLLDMEAGVRRELWPDDGCLGLPMLLPGGEIGTLLRFEHETEPERWTYALEFRGSPA